MRVEVTVHRPLFVLLFSLAACGTSDSDSRWTFASSQFRTTPVFSNVQTFGFKIEVEDALSPGAVVDPPLALVDYTVVGSLVAGTPSGFPAFELIRMIEGPDFYSQGSSIRFEISPTADLSDGVQITDLTGDDPVFTFDGREVGNGRFHPARVELNADGTGRIQNSNNVPTLDPRLDVEPGTEYITDVTFDPARITVVEIAL